MRIVIYGAGRFGAHVKKEIEESDRNDLEVIAFIDNYKKKVAGTDIPVYNEEEFFSQYVKCSFTYIIAISDIGVRTRIIVSLLGRGIDSILIYESPFVRTLARVFSENNQFSRFIKDYKTTKVCFNGRIQYHIVDHCNLNCKGCSSFSNIAQPGWVTAENAKIDMSLLKDIIPEINNITLYGGEALLNPEIEEIIRIVRRTFPETKINVFSNGLLIPNIGESVVRTMNEEGVYFVITQYPPTRRIIDRIIDFLENNRVHYVFEMEVDSFFHQYTLKNTNAIDNWKICKQNHECYTLFERHLYRCPCAPHLIKEKDLLGLSIIKNDKQAGVPIDAGLSGYEVLNILENIPYSICRYCNPDSIPLKVEGFLGMSWEAGKNKAKVSDWLG